MNPILWASSLSTNVPSSAATATHSTSHATPLNSLPMKIDERVPWFFKANYLQYGRKPSTTTVSSSVCSTSFANISLPSGASTSTTISGTTITLPAAIASAVKLQSANLPKPVTTPVPPQEKPVTIPTPAPSSDDMEQSNSLHFEEHELVCAEVLASLKRSAAVEGFFVRRLSVSKVSSSDDDSELFSLSKSQKKKVKRNINPCPEHRRKHQRCPPGCTGRKRDRDAFESGSPMGSPSMGSPPMASPPMTKEEEMQEAFSSPQHPQSTTTVTA